MVEILAHRAGERIGDDQRRRGEIVGARLRIDAALEVAVAGEHRGDDEILVVDGVGDLLGQRAGVADAGGAAVADEVEAERVEIVLQAGLVEIVGDDLRARRERCLHPRLGRQALLARALRASRPAAISTLGFEVLVHEVIAAMTTSPSVDLVVLALDRRRLAGTSAPSRRLPRPCRRRRRAPLMSRILASAASKALSALESATRSCGRFGPASDGTTVGEVELQRVGEDRIGRVVGAEHALRLGVGLDQRDALRIAAGRLQVGERVAGRPGRSRRSRRTPAPCWRWWRGPRATGARGRRR